MHKTEIKHKFEVGEIIQRTCTTEGNQYFVVQGFIYKSGYCLNGFQYCLREMNEDYRGGLLELGKSEVESEFKPSEGYE